MGAPSPASPAPVAARRTIGLWAHRLSDLDGRTGVGRYAVEISRALAAMTTENEEASTRYEMIGGREREPVVAALRHLPVARSWPPRRLLHGAWMALGRPSLEAVGPKVDLLHVLFPSFPVRTGRALVGTIHDLFTLDHPDWYGRGEAHSVSTSIRRLAERADAIICVSAWVAGQVRDRFGVEAPRLHVVHSGIGERWRHAPLDSADRRAVNPFGRPYVVAVGAVTPRKNLGVVLRALTQVEDVVLVLVGPVGDAARPTMELIDQLGLGQRVHVVGRVDDDQLVELVRGAEALVHPSLDEGFGFPPLEAMAAGTPALVGKGGSLPEVVGDAAPVLPADDPERWAAAIEELIADGDVRAERVEAGQRRAAGFTWDRAATETAAVHRGVLDDASGEAHRRR